MMAINLEHLLKNLHDMDKTVYAYHTETRTMLADINTPVAVYMRLRDLYPQSVLMESSDYHDSSNSRSYIGINPIASISVCDGLVEMKFPDGSLETRSISEDFGCDDAINSFLGRFRVSGDGACSCGVFGYMAFDAVKYFENIPVKTTPTEDGGIPDILYIMYKDIIVFEHYTSRMTVTVMCEENCGGHAEDCANDELDMLEHDINRLTVREYGFRAVGGCVSTLTDDEHKANIRRGIQHCLKGDVFQIVLSRRFMQKYTGDDFKLYRTLRSINPSPYLFYFDFGGFRIFGSSPETHCRIENGRAYIDPIAGTTEHTGCEAQDIKAAEYLRNDAKENAEHVMLVDLARNDLSRNCHGVKLDFFKDMQFYSHVIHLVSRVSGTLDKDSNPVRTFIDTFPAGTLSGAPKVRAMQLISEYEPHSRGAYGGCIGYIGLDGSLNQAITIRTFISRNNELCFQAGGGIVAASDEDYELQEVNNKLAALRKAVELAENI